MSRLYTQVAPAYIGGVLWDNGGMERQDVRRSSESGEALHTADGEPLEDKGIPVRHRTADKEQRNQEDDLWGDPNPPVDETDDGPRAGV